MRSFSMLVVVSFLVLLFPASIDAQGQLHTPMKDSNIFSRVKKGDVLNAVRLKEIRDAADAADKMSPDENNEAFEGRSSVLTSSKIGAAKPKGVGAVSLTANGVNVESMHNLLTDINEATAFVERQSVNDLIGKSGRKES
mmetsp:Transcript_10378/g.23279  ORF Transcript_10378/g.23279 Transcript_10378/m.23279 type:complete len:140 (-) Transcript_10378:180-599(-)